MQRTRNRTTDKQRRTILLGVAEVLGLLALLAVALALRGLVLDHGLHEVAEGGDPQVLAVAVGVVGVRGFGDLEGDVGSLGDGLSAGGVGDDVLGVDVFGLDREVDALLGGDGVLGRDLELGVLVVLVKLTAVLGDEIVVLHGLGHELGGGCRGESNMIGQGIRNNIGEGEILAGSGYWRRIELN